MACGSAMMRLSGDLGRWARLSAPGLYHARPNASHSNLVRWNRRLGARALAATSSAKPGAVPLEQFSIAAPAEPIFPELLRPGCSAVCIGIDPDISGALAVLQWRNPEEGAETDRAVWSRASVAVHDMPVTAWQMASRTKKQPCSQRLLEILRPYAALQGEDCLVRVALEVTTPAHMSGKHAWFSVGYSTGVLDALLTSLGIGYERVHASIWKRQMGLFKMGKPGSMALAQQLLPQAAGDLRRKKDHGRAEALLIATWALGCRAEAAAAAARSVPGSDVPDPAQAPWD